LLRLLRVAIRPLLLFFSLPPLTVSLLLLLSLLSLLLWL
jgi:hypothetical protein